ncbi:hypothetical protein IJI17_00050 [Candidatus Saccharibacteria bacterium]|nr:hypothetical protein [Candidatus Saccharibacteria bacterium]
MFGIGKYALRDIDTGDSIATNDPHEAARFVRCHGNVKDETGNTFGALRVLGYDHNGERAGAGNTFFGNLFGTNEPVQSSDDDDKTFVDRLFGW